MLLMLDYGIYYEFIPEEYFDKEEKIAVNLENVQLNKKYAMVISTTSGLWRYQIGDTIQFTSLNPFRIKITGRTKHFINAFGEELMVHNADEAIAEACRITNAAITDYTVAPIYMSESSGAHQWIIEFEKLPDDLNYFTYILDNTLKEKNSDYEAKRYNDYVIAPPSNCHCSTRHFLSLAEKNTTNLADNTKCQDCPTTEKWQTKSCKSSMKFNKKTYLLLSFVSIFAALTAQDSVISVKAEKIYADNIGNLYTINDGTITKYFTNKQTKTFSIKTFGTLQTVDITNPLRVLLYFSDFQRILFLDSQLSQNGDAIELPELGLEQCALVCTSFNNGFWAYNQANNELVRFSQMLEINVKTGNLKRILNTDIHPTFMTEHNGKLYLNSPETGILVFDIYGCLHQNHSHTAHPYFSNTISVYFLHSSK
ncbi:MAG: hypothetical protein KatS3mg028_0529 [Bacteroidia bacterium]|nr:MAG: hypothetical protein KatS3mg028_0529 [Bacteroidia bacterium]